MSNNKKNLQSLKDSLNAEKYKLAETTLRDESIDIYERFDFIYDLYPASTWIQYPFKALAERELKGKVPDENLPHVRPRYWLMDDCERHRVITFSSMIESFMDYICDEFGKDFEELTQEELNASVISLFAFENDEYKFSFNELKNHLIEYAIENKLSGITYDW